MPDEQVGANRPRGIANKLSSRGIQARPAPGPRMIDRRTRPFLIRIRNTRRRLTQVASRFRHTKQVRCGVVSRFQKGESVSLWTKTLIALKFFQSMPRHYEFVIRPLPFAKQPSPLGDHGAVRSVDEVSGTGSAGLFV